MLSKKELHHHHHHHHLHVPVWISDQNKVMNLFIYSTSFPEVCTERLLLVSSPTTALKLKIKMVRYKTTKTKTFFKIKRIKNKEKKLLKSKRKFVRQRTKTKTNEIKNKINKKQISHMSIKIK